MYAIPQSYNRDVSWHRPKMTREQKSELIESLSAAWGMVVFVNEDLAESARMFAQGGVESPIIMPSVVNRGAGVSKGPACSNGRG